jgi:hypothetical protein
VRGQALVIGGTPENKQSIENGIPKQSQGARNCYYSPDKNIDVEKGTISFWVKPIDWDGKTKGFNVLFRTAAGSNFFMLYKYWSDDRLLFLRGEQEKWTSAVNRIGDWKTGEWHHVVVTWSSAEIRLFVDGAMVCFRRNMFPFEKPTPVEPLSIGPGGSWEKAFNGRSLIDEFRIYSRPLREDEVISLYRHDSANVEIEAGLLTVGEKTPVINGRIDDFEYAFTDTAEFSTFNKISVKPEGNSLKKSNEKPQHCYGLSYDRSNFYVAVRTEFDQASVAQTGDGNVSLSERVELFLSSVNSKKKLYHFAFTPSGGVYADKNGDNQWIRKKMQVENVLSSGVWTLEAAIPFAELGINAAPDGQSWRINICRVYTSTGKISSLAPVKGTLDDRNNFVTLVFRPDAPSIRIANWSDSVKKQAAEDLSVQTKNDRSEIKFENISDTTKAYGMKSRSASLFFNGKATPHKTLWEGALAPDFAIGESRIVEIVDGIKTMLYMRKWIHEDQAPMKTFFIYTQAKKRLFVAALHRAKGDIQVRFLRKDGTCAFQSRQAIPEDSVCFNALFDLDFEKLIPGYYTVKVDYVAPDGKSLETWEQAYRIPRKDDPDFLPYVDEDADKVMAPWTPLKTGNGKVEMWGRIYDFSKGILFSSLISQGEDILAGPDTLRMDGKILVPTATVSLKKISGSDMETTWEKNAAFDKLKVESRITTHFDGYCEVSMTFTPAEGSLTIPSLSLDIPLRGAAATLVRDNRLSTLEGGKSGAVGEYWCQDLFSGRGSFLWVGNNKVGFNWLSQDLKNWNCKNTAKSVEIVRQGNTAILRFNFVDTSLKLDAPRTIKFAFTLTPSRPLDGKILRMRNEKELQMWCQPWQYFAYPDYDTADRGEIERAGNGFNEVFLYLSDGLTSPFCPEWAWWEEEWRSPSRPPGEWTGDHKDLKVRNRSCYVGAGSASYANFMQHKRCEFFERAKTPITSKARNYYFDDGATTNPAYREHALNVYRMIGRTGPDAKTWGHQGWLRVMPMMHFSEIIVGGEAVDQQVGRDGGYYNILTPEMFRATFSPYIWGMKMVFLDMNVRTLSESHPDKYLAFSLSNPETKRALLHSYGYCILHDVDIHDGYRQSLKLRETIWGAQDKIGWDENVKFFPYWDNDAVKLTSPKSNRILASAYSNNGKMLLAVLNDTDKGETVKLDLNLEKLGVKAGLKGSDVWSPEKAYTLSNVWEEKVGARGFSLIVFDKAD